MAELITHPRCNLNQLTGSWPEWCIVSKESENTFKQLHMPAICKDYAHEILITNVFPELGTSLFPVYGMKYNVKENPMDEDKLRLSYVLSPYGKEKSREEQFKSFINNIPLLETFHNMGNISDKLKVYIEDTFVIIEADKWWMSSPFHLSYFLIGMRALAYKDETSLEAAFQNERNACLYDIFPDMHLETFLPIIDEVSQGWKKDVEKRIRFRGDDSLESVVYHNCGVADLVFTIASANSETITSYMHYYPICREKAREIGKKYRSAFVYGTLLEGMRNHHVLGEKRKYYRNGVFSIPFDMVDLGAFPGLIKSDSHKYYYGEFYLINKEDEMRMDMLEGYPHFYDKEEVDFHIGCSAILYFLPRERYEHYPEVVEKNWKVCWSKKQNESN